MQKIKVLTFRKRNIASQKNINLKYVNLCKNNSIICVSLCILKLIFLKQNHTFFLNLYSHNKRNDTQKLYAFYCVKGFFYPWNLHKTVSAKTFKRWAKFLMVLSLLTLELSFWVAYRRYISRFFLFMAKRRCGPFTINPFHTSFSWVSLSPWIGAPIDVPYKLIFYDKSKYVPVGDQWAFRGPGNSCMWSVKAAIWVSIILPSHLELMKQFEAIILVKPTRFRTDTFLWEYYIHIFFFRPVAQGQMFAFFSSYYFPPSFTSSLSPDRQYITEYLL